MKNTLWTKDFTITSIGSLVSMMGNTMAGFVISLFILDYSKSPSLFAVFMFLYTLPQIAAPLIAGPLMDRFSRRRTIYLLDFVSSGLYLFAGLSVLFKFFSFPLLAGLTFCIGTINSTYQVAFQSFYPMLISKGNYSKAYSVSSTMEMLTYAVIPVATYLYKLYGIFPLMMINFVSFLTAALFEVNISDIESHLNTEAKKRFDFHAYISSSKDGFMYLFREKGLLRITLYFAIMSLASGASSVITLPWFKSTFKNGEFTYMQVWVFTIVGRMLGGVLYYRRRIPHMMKFSIALTVYVALGLVEGTYLYTPLLIMELMCFIIGILGVTSFNIRISATQSYVPNDIKGRFNGAFIMMTTAGTLAGQALAGVFMTFMQMRHALTFFMFMSSIAAIIIIGLGRNDIAPIYNRET